MESLFCCSIIQSMTRAALFFSNIDSPQIFPFIDHFQRIEISLELYSLFFSLVASVSLLLVMISLLNFLSYLSTPETINGRSLFFSLELCKARLFLVSGLRPFFTSLRHVSSKKLLAGERKKNAWSFSFSQTGIRHLRSLISSIPFFPSLLLFFIHSFSPLTSRLAMSTGNLRIDKYYVTHIRGLYGFQLITGS